MNTITSTLYNIMEWITKFAYVNLLWVTFSLLGGIIFGFYPATTSMFAMVRDWLRNNPDLPVLKTYWNYYKQDFLKSNLLGTFLNLLFILIAIDVYYIQLNIDEQMSWTYIPLFAFMLLVAIFLFYIFPSFAHYDLNSFGLLKNAFLIMLINPVLNILMTICLVSSFFIMWQIPALLFIFGGTTYAFITTWFSLQAFDNVQQKQEDI
ncbi:hypothetical protein GCM10008986_25140 [Salinibacillus aidingensis]|uniref:Membrane protein YesL n=1 Tax=Salinibacillus aidingensis TaxID=237684 RepID=A0ABN1BHF4_9BACI